MPGLGFRLGRRVVRLAARRADLGAFAPSCLLEVRAGGTARRVRLVFRRLALPFRARALAPYGRWTLLGASRGGVAYWSSDASLRALRLVSGVRPGSLVVWPAHRGWPHLVAGGGGQVRGGALVSGPLPPVVLWFPGASGTAWFPAVGVGACPGVLLLGPSGFPAGLLVPAGQDFRPQPAFRGWQG